jgi:hypothetical protein
MAYVERRAGTIFGVYALRQPGYAEEELPDNHPDVLAFRSPPPPSKSEKIDNRLNGDGDFEALVGETAARLGVPVATFVAGMKARRR